MLNMTKSWKIIACCIILLVWIFFPKRKHLFTESPLLHYDYIVVGGGTTGCVLAAGLSSDPNRTVLLIEAGGEFNFLASIPLAVTLLQGSQYDWAFRTQTQKYSSWGLHNKSQFWPRGKGLGGSNHLNYMVHMEADRDDYRFWKTMGIEEWNFDKMKIYFDRMLGRTNDFCKCSYDYISIMLKLCPINICKKINLFDQHSNMFRMKLSKISAYKSPLTNVLKQAVDYLNLKGIIFKEVESTTYKGKRWSSYNGYLEPVLHRTNLHVLLNTKLKKILFSKQKVIGVETDHESRNIIYCKREVILSAGTIQSPQILMLSGIGPKNDLQNINISKIADIPGVGANLYDHFNMPLYVSIDKPISLTIDKVQNIRKLWKYLYHRKGPFASIPIAGTISGSNNIGLVLFGMGSTDERILKEIANYRTETFRELFPFYKNTSQEGFVFLASCIQPKSRGFITIKNNDYKNPPFIDPQYLKDLYDIRCMTKAVKLADSLIQTPAFKKIGAKIHWPKFSECLHLQNMTSDIYIECIIRTGAFTGYHPGGTCKMGDPRSKDTVVDYQLRVKEVTGLRVVDASILPLPLTQFPNSALIAMADRAAQLILNNQE